MAVQLTILRRRRKKQEPWRIGPDTTLPKRLYPYSSEKVSEYKLFNIKPVVTLLFWLVHCAATGGSQVGSETLQRMAHAEIHRQTL